jgi:hypothetical protein
MNLSLYALTDQYRTALSELPDDADAEQIYQALANLEGQIALKGQNVAAFVLNLEAEAEAIDNAARKLKARAASTQRKADGLRGYLFTNMKVLGITEIRANDGTFKAKIVKNPPAVELTGPIPAEYERVIPEKREPDRNKIKDELKAGVIIENARLVQGERLKIE